MNFSVIYITTKDRNEAQKIAQTLVEERLAACANIIEKIDSIYWWEGKVQNSKEALLIVKTKGSLVLELTKKVKALHSYECPCIVSLPIESGDPQFLSWIEKETR